ncbi:MAG: type II secretion system ATPase GspE [Pseudomonadota bacterium]
MKSPWEKDPKTVQIKDNEVTEHFSFDDFLKSKAGLKAPSSGGPAQAKPAGPKIPSAQRPDGPSSKPPASKTSAASSEATQRAKAPEKTDDVDEAIDGVLGKLKAESAEEFPQNLKTEGISSPKDTHLGEILLKTSKLTREQLEDALKSQAEGDQSERLGEILLKKKFIIEDDLLRALSFQLNVPIMENLSKENVDPELATKIPINFAKKYGLIPLRKDRGHVIVAISDAVDLGPMDDLRILLQANVKPVLASRRSVLDMINRVYDRAATKTPDNLMEDLEEPQIEDVDLEETQDLLDSEDEAPIIRLVNTLLFRAVKERASDIHIEPVEKEISVRFRIDGVLYEIMKPPKRAQNSISSRIKIMAQLDIAEKRIPQDGRIRIRLAGRDVDIRVSTLPTSFGERIVLRLLDTSNVLLSLEDLGFDKRQLGMIAKIITKAHGIFLVTGPTGSGKTTTLYACLTRINAKERNIITVEDPVEIQIQGIGQIHVNPKVDLTFANGLRSILRQDPDVIMVGEIRDLETAEIAIQASLTGHFVFSTLHTNDAASSVTRLVDMGVEPFLVSSSLVAVMAQRLIRVVCKQCRQPHKPDDEELKEIGIDPARAAQHTIYRSKGCSECWNTGYKGRSGIYEILPIDEELRSLILKSADATSLKKSALSRGMRTLRDDGAEKVLSGVTTMEEVLRVTQEEMTIE